jgi:hypothetical protein
MIVRRASAVLDQVGRHRPGRAAGGVAGACRPAGQPPGGASWPATRAAGSVGRTVRSLNRGRSPRPWPGRRRAPAGRLPDLPRGADRGAGGGRATSRPALTKHLLPIGPAGWGATPSRHPLKAVPVRARTAPGFRLRARTKPPHTDPRGAVLPGLRRADPSPAPDRPPPPLLHRPMPQGRRPAPRQHRPGAPGTPAVRGHLGRQDHRVLVHR